MLHKQTSERGKIGKRERESEGEEEEGKGKRMRALKGCFAMRIMPSLCTNKFHSDALADFVPFRLTFLLRTLKDVIVNGTLRFRSSCRCSPLRIFNYNRLKPVVSTPGRFLSEGHAN